MREKAKSATVDLAVNVTAQFYWRDPPKDRAEQIMREQANASVKAMAGRFNESIRILMLEMVQIMRQYPSTMKNPDSDS